MLFYTATFLILASGALGCNPNCKRKTTEDTVIQDDALMMGKMLEIVNNICQEWGSCNHTVYLTDQGLGGPGNVTLKYSSLSLEPNATVEFRKSREGMVTGTVPLIYNNMTLIFPNNVQVGVPVNLFRFTILMKLPDQQESECIFQWKRLEVSSFQFDASNLVDHNELTSALTVERLNEKLNSNSFIDYLNKEVSICNEKSFLHQVTAAFILVTVISALGNALSETLVSLLC